TSHQRRSNGRPWPPGLPARPAPPSLTSPKPHRLRAGSSQVFSLGGLSLFSHTATRRVLSRPSLQSRLPLHQGCANPAPARPELGGNPGRPRLRIWGAIHSDSNLLLAHRPCA